MKNLSNSQRRLPGQNRGWCRGIKNEKHLNTQQDQQHLEEAASANSPIGSIRQSRIDERQRDGWVLAQNLVHPLNAMPSLAYTWSARALFAVLAFPSNMSTLGGALLVATRTRTRTDPAWTTREERQAVLEHTTWCLRELEQLQIELQRLLKREVGTRTAN